MNPSSETPRVTGAVSGDAVSGGGCSGAGGTLADAEPAPNKFPPIVNPSEGTSGRSRACFRRSWITLLSNPWNTTGRFSTSGRDVGEAANPPLPNTGRLGGRAPPAEDAPTEGWYQLEDASDVGVWAPANCCVW